MKKQFLLGLMAMLLPWTAWAEPTFTVTVEPTGGKQLVYAGDATKNNVEVKVSVLFDGEEEAEDLTAEDFEIVSYHNSTTNEDFLRNAGTYTVTLKGLKAYRGYTIPTQTFTIEKAELKNLTFNNATKQYGDPFDAAVLAQIVEFGEGSGLLTGQDGENADELEKQNALSCFSVEMFREGEEVGDDQIAEVKGKTGADNTSNYYYTGKDVVYITVTKKELAAILANAESVYNGTEIELKTLTPTIKDGVVVDDNVSVSFTSVKDNATLLNVGKYTLIAELDENSQEKYTLANNGEVEYEITKAKLNISVADKVTLGKTYDGEAPDEDITTSFALTTTPANISDGDLEKITLKIEDPKADAGEYDVKLYVGEEEIEDVAAQTGLPNYTITLGANDKENYTYTISKKKVLYYFTGTAEYGGDNAKTINNVEPTFVGNYGFVEKEGEGWQTKPTAKVEENVKNVGSYDLVVDEELEAKEFDNYDVVQVTEDNIENLEIENIENLNKYVVTKKDMTITIKELSIAFDEATLETLETWKKNNTNTKIEPNTGEYSKDRSMMRDLIKFDFSDEVKEAGFATGSYTGGIVVNFKTDEELTKENKSKLTGYGYTDVETLYNNFGGVEEIKKSVVGGDLVIGSYTKPLVLDVNNGEETEETEDESTWPVAKLIEKYNGVKVDQVTIKNLKNNFSGQLAENGKYDFYTDYKLEAEKWYTLVLPFDVEVADLSYQLGYAIVNIPNSDATPTTDKIYYKLTMGLVPANTLMLFKVAKATDCENKELVFENVTISAPGEDYEWATDKAGHEYRGVYTYTELTEDYEYIYNSGQGGVTKASLVVSAKNHNAEAYPFSGYFIIDAPETANVRIFVEEIDGTVTALNAVTGEAVGTSAEGWYTVGGMKLNAQPTQKGIYINNGKKVVIK